MSYLDCPSLRTAIIVPAAQCPCGQLGNVLAQIGPQDIVVAVFNGCRCAGACATRWAEHSSFRSLHFCERVGAAWARNAGAASVPDADFLAFADADDRVQSGWLEALLVPLGTGSADVVGGGLLVQRGLATATVLPGRDYWHEQALFGGNIALTRQAWGVIGGFDASLAYCEDTDLAWRAKARGLRIAIAESALVSTRCRAPWHEARQRARWGWWSAVLLNRHDILDARHLPSLAQISNHMRNDGWARWPRLASATQWFGQRVGELSRRR